MEDCEGGALFADMASAIGPDDPILPILPESIFEAATDIASDEDGPLSLIERLLAAFGAWAGSVAERWNPPTGPFFTSDGRPACLDYSRDEPRHPISDSAPNRLH